MSRFNKEYLDNFLGILRKYMQMRGGLSQKDLAESIGASVSTVSRFLNKKTDQLDDMMIAQMVAKLEIPLYEMIDFVEEDETARFKKLVAFYKEAETADNDDEGDEDGSPASGGAGGSAQRSTTANINIGGRRRAIPFGSEGDQTISEKLSSLSPRQKAYLKDFLELDMEGRDLMVDLGNSLFRYFKQRGVEF